MGCVVTERIFLTTLSLNSIIRRAENQTGKANQTIKLNFQKIPF